uniref:alpha-1,2-fucosyltransferase n=1 Tax=Algoriphagus sp. TaxID=1872435 RepID=UPI0040489EC1
MIIVKLMGGLGNQLFQYAAAKNLAKNNQTELLIDVESGFEGDPYKRSFALSNFCIQSKVADPEMINLHIRKSKIIKYLITKLFDLYPIGRFKYLNEAFYHYDSRIANFITSNDIYLEGYFHSERYFNLISSEIRTEFELKHPADSINSKYLAQIERSESVAVHVRKYNDALVNNVNQMYGSCTTEYYRKAIKHVHEKIHNPFFFVFSDDIEWTKKNIIVDTDKVEYISHNDLDKGHEDIRLMKACKHNIIANSSFSWWGAWLNKNPNKIVIAPERWLESEIFDFKDVVPPNWIKL